MQERFLTIRLKYKEAGKYAYVNIIDDILKFSDKITSHMVKFDTPRQAMQFIKEHKLERGGVTALIVNSDELLRQASSIGAKTINTPMYYLQQVGTDKKICFDPMQNNFILKSVKTGFSCWNDYKLVETLKYSIQETKANIELEIKIIEPN